MDNTRLFLYAGLGFLGLLIYQEWQADYGPQPVQQVAPTVQTQQIQQPGAVIDESLDLPDNAELPPTVSDPAAPTVAEGISRLIQVDTDVVRALIDTRGGVVVSLSLKQYPTSLERPDDWLELLFQRQDEVYLLQSGLRSSTSKAPTHHSVFEVAQDSYQMADGEDELLVPMRWFEDGIEVVKTYRFKRGDYLFDVDHEVNNQSAEPWSGSEYRQIQRSRPLEESRLLYTYTGAVYYNEEVKYEKEDFGDMEDSQLKVTSDGGWIAMIQHYFLSSWIPDQQEKNLVYTISNLRTYPSTYLIGMRGVNRQVEPGQSFTFQSQAFVGPKLIDELAEIAPGLELTVDYGALTFLSKPLYWLLSFYHEYVGNWGVAIILLTLTIKLVFYKLSETSYRSMARMRKVSPKLATIKERYGHDRQKMNQAMMDLYKTEKINPMGGCLPMLVQIPVFIALYWALLESVDLRQAPFMLWINDLSVKDPYFILPLIMGVSMFIQQKLNPAPPDPIQAKVMMALPFVFTIFFAFFPSGLVLYWVVNNILSIAQQWVITRRIESEAG